MADFKPYFVHPVIVFNREGIATCTNIGAATLSALMYEIGRFLRHDSIAVEIVISDAHRIRITWEENNV